ncbi:unnamed protein product [Musa hybrid cultivar]
MVGITLWLSHFLSVYVEGTHNVVRKLLLFGKEINAQNIREIKL